MIERNKQIKVGVAGILLRDNKILLNLRNKKLGKGLWDLPAGHLKFGERFEDALIREFNEETGLNVKVRKLVSVAPNQAYGNHYVMFTFLVSLVHSQQKARLLESSKHQKWEWFDLSSLPDNLFISAKNALRDFKASKLYRN